MAKAKCKRNKKYVPKTIPHKKQIDNIFKHQGAEGVIKLMSRMGKPEVRKLSMTWNVIEADRLANLHRLANGLDEHEKFSTNMLQNIYSGDLIIAMAEGQIYGQQKFNLKIVSLVKDEQTGKSFTVEFEKRFETPIDFTEFLKGSKTHKVDRGNGVKTRWKGVTDEWCDDLNSKYPQDHFNLIDANAVMWCETAYLDQYQERNTKLIKFNHQMRKVPLGASR